VTLGVVLLLLFFAFWYAYSYYRASGQPSAHPPTPSCTQSAAAPVPAAITLNVYNATDRNGLAARTATQLRQRGFKVATVSNDPLQRAVAGTADVRYGKSGAAAAKVVAATVRGARLVPDSRTDSSVDLVVGSKFTALAPVHKAAAVKPASKPAAKPKATAATTKAGTRPTATTTPSGTRTTTPAC
jgi:hypothetical protein